MSNHQTNKITLELVKKHCKGYTEAYGYYSCRKSDFDWLINEVERLRLDLSSQLNKEKQVDEQFEQLQAENEWYKQALKTIVSMRHTPIIQAIIGVAEKALKG